jgi:hypothetical protein
MNAEQPTENREPATANAEPPAASQEPATAGAVAPAEKRGPAYVHTQEGGLHHIVYGTAVFLLGMSLFFPGAFGPPLMWLFIAVPLVFLAFCFVHLTTRDDGQTLAVEFGPIPAFRTRIRYAEMLEVEPGRTDFWDGWGIHYLPRRGMIYNLWGRDCVVITTRKGVIRVGTDDVSGLVYFLRSRMDDGR